MKVLLRVLLILAAALVVGGVTYALAQSGVVQINAPTRGQGDEIFQLPNSTTKNGDSTAIVQGEGRGRRGRAAGEFSGGELGGSGLRGLNDMVQSFSVVAVIVALCMLIQFMWHKSRNMRRRRPREKPQAAA